MTILADTWNPRELEQPSLKQTVYFLKVNGLTMEIEADTDKFSVLENLHSKSFHTLVDAIKLSKKLMSKYYRQLSVDIGMKEILVPVLKSSDNI